ncbi:MtrAB system histidine kinase MtrB [Corynebacterium poyangense]|uniref:MtrAB system histidine kinase MtrB n=1 Tax=Corynebacterium poyangense TaxID=2684405 RepID=UPI00296245AF|nr:MtrAB system histidine kinase MtrB [Corynebacterium poyangense]
MKATLLQARDRALESWRTSLQLQVIGSIFIVSAVVMILIGVGLVSLIAQSLINAKLDIANSEIDRARVSVEQQIDATTSSSSLQVRLNSARATLTARSGSGSEAAAVYEPVLLVPNSDNPPSTSPEGYKIPDQLVHFVEEGQVSYQFSTIERSDGSTYKALIVGSPTATDIPGLQVYLVLSLEQEESTLAMMRGLLSAAGMAVVVLLVGITWLMANQVTAPVRSASRIAQRLADGHLRERMVVNGENEMARLALSFNTMAESLSAKIQQLEEYGDLQRQFTSDVSHELRTPLTTVRMAADMIASQAEEMPAHTRRASELMTRELDRFEALLADLLEISRHDAGVADLSESQLDLRSCIQAAWQQVSHLSDKLSVEVNFHLPDSPVMVSTDSRRIERILRNLLANALDHSEGRPIDVEMKANDQAVGIIVTDHGVGLKPGQEELVFNRFWRADASRVRHSGGTGLGLAIAREDAQLHGGTLDATGTFGVGSTFRLIIPRTPGGEISDTPIDLTAPEPPHVIDQPVLPELEREEEP